VLVVDSNNFARTVIRAIINSSFPGLNVIEAKSSSEAIAKSQQCQINWIIIDNGMLDLRLFDFIEQIQLLLPQPKISILSNDYKKRTHDKALALGINYLHKPIEEQTIVSIFEQSDFEESGFEKSSFKQS